MGLFIKKKNQPFYHGVERMLKVVGFPNGWPTSNTLDSRRILH